jgi:hypothetical protein
MFLAHLNKSTQSNVPAVVEVATVPAVPSVIIRPKIEPEPAPVPVIIEPVQTVRIESVESVQVLKGQTRRGDFVHNSQKMGTQRDFRNVSENWLNTGTMTIPDAIQRIEQQRGRTIDKVIPFSDFRAVADSNGFALLNQRTGERFNLASDALDQFAERSGIGRTLPRRLLNGDQDDIETLAIVAQNGLRKLGEKTCLLRTRESDSSIRAFLSEEYAVIDHTWFLETLQRIVPGGLVSHFRSPDGGDSIFFNLLIPDSIRAESDSEYGGMLACGNGETGRSRLRSLPSIFRAICQNGCIWDQVEGLSYVMQVHRGEIELATLAAQIRDNLNRQIPLLGNGIDAMMKTRSIQSIGNVSPVAVIGSVLNTLNVPGITREQASAIVTGFDDQRTETGRVSAFDILQGFTKAAQGFDAFAQETTERAAGSAMLWAPEVWQTVFAMAERIDSKQLKRIFSKSVVA